MSVPYLNFCQKQQTQKTAMNVSTMLADFLEFVTPKFPNKHLQDLLSASIESLLTNGRSVTAIGRGIESYAQEKHCIKLADRLLSYSATQLCNRPCLWYAGMTSAIVTGKQPLIFVHWSNADRERRHFFWLCGR